MSLELRNLFSEAFPEFSVLVKICDPFVAFFTKNLSREDAFEAKGEPSQKFKPMFVMLKFDVL